MRCDLDIVVVSYNCQPELADCLQSLLNSKDRDAGLRVIVVDNASSDGTREYLAALAAVEERLSVRLNDENVGFSRATNQAIQMGRNPFVLVLNPDTVVDPSTLAPLCRILQEDPAIGLLGCRLVQADGQLDPACKRNLPTLTSSARRLFMPDRWFGTDAYRSPELDEYASGRVGAVNGAFMLTTRQTLDLVGQFDESYWMYGEDLDLCRRMQAHGLVVWYVGHVTAVHLKAASSGRVRGWRTNFHFHASMLRYYMTGRQRRRYVLAPLVLCGITIHWGATTLRYVAQRMGYRT